MTYCISGICNKGLVFLSDTRTNSGVDNISSFKKLHYYETENSNIQIVLSHAGNLATCQEFEARIEQICQGRLGNPEELLASSFSIAAAAGRELKTIIREVRGGQEENKNSFTASLMLGTRYNNELSLYLIYPEGNFIKATKDTPFFQIGETKFGRPLIINHYNPEMEMDDLLQLFRDSLDMTITANLSVGYPADYIKLSANDAPPEQGRFLDKQDIDLFSKYVDLRFSKPADKYPEQHLGHLATLAERVLENVQVFRENIRSSNLLDDERKSLLFKVADRIDFIIEDAKSEEFFVNSSNEQKSTWLQKYGASLRSQFEILTSPELLGEKTIPLGLLVSFSALGFAAGGGIGAALGALTARAISTKNDITKDIQELLSRD